MAEKLFKVKITYKCRIAGEKKKPGDIVEIPENTARLLISAKRATEDLKWEPSAKSEKKEPKK